MTKEQEESIEILEGMVKSYIEADECGLSNNDFKEEIKVYDTVLNLITKLQKENKEKDKQLDLIIEEFYKKMKISTNCYIQRKRGTEQCLNHKNCKECLKQYFEKLAKEKGE